MMDDVLAGLKVGLGKVSVRYAAAVLAGVLGAALLSGCGSILSSDITPPPDNNPQDAASTASPGELTVRPLVLPDLAAGKAIYTEKCAPCHGEKGMGDGPQASKLSNPPARIGSPQVARPARPVDWFSVVTQGRIDKMMPGFDQGLSDRQRMDVVAYALSLSSDFAALAQGKSLYQENCAACHGESGKGDGAQASALKNGMPDWSDPVRLMRFSAQELFDTISQGKGEMTGYAAQLDENQRWALAAYVRSLARSIPQGEQASAAGVSTSASTPTDNTAGTTPAPAQTPSASGTPAPTAKAAASGTVRLKGQLSNGSGGPLPAGMEVTLAGFDNMSPAVDLRTTADTAGNCAFDGVQLVPGRMYLLSTRFNGVKFSSDLIKADDLRPGEEARLPIVIYETSTDTRPLKVERMHIFLQFAHSPTKSQSGAAQAKDVKLDRVSVVTLYIISNPTNKVIIPPADGQPVLTFPLPYGATNLQFDEVVAGQRYIQEDGKIGDLKPIYPSPAQDQVLFAYELPYIDRLDLKIPLPLDVKDVVVAVPVGNVHLSGTGLENGGVKAVQNTQFQFYNRSNLPAGSSLEMSLSGSPAGSSAALDPNTTNLIIGLGAFVLAVGLFAYFLLRSRRTPALAAAGEVEIEADAEQEDEVSVEEILDAIVTLDDMYRAGKLPQAAYQQRRAELKAQLAHAKKS